MDQQSLHEHIEAYLLDSMDPEQRAGFEVQLAQDETLRKEVQRHRTAMTALRYSHYLAAKDRLRDIDKDMIRPQLAARPAMRLVRRLAVAATILLVIAAGAHIYIHQTYGHQSMAKHFFASHHTDAFRNDDAPVAGIDAQFAEAEAHFRAERYEEAIRAFEKLAAEDSLLKAKAEWNLALSYLALDPESPAFHALLEMMIANPRHAFHARAVTLQDRKQSTLYKMVH